ncbi:hypothetical protein ACOMHN_038949 [Nucella lapillus]
MDSSNFSEHLNLTQFHIGINDADQWRSSLGEDWERQNAPEQGGVDRERYDTNHVPRGWWPGLAQATPCAATDIANKVDVIIALITTVLVILVVLTLIVLYYFCICRERNRNSHGSSLSPRTDEGTGDRGLTMPAEEETVLMLAPRQSRRFRLKDPSPQGRLRPKDPSPQRRLRPEDSVTYSLESETIQGGKDLTRPVDSFQASKLGPRCKTHPLKSSTPINSPSEQQTLKQRVPSPKDR